MPPPPPSRFPLWILWSLSRKIPAIYAMWPKSRAGRAGFFPSPCTCFPARHGSDPFRRNWRRHSVAPGWRQEDLLNLTIYLACTPLSHLLLRRLGNSPLLAAIRSVRIPDCPTRI